jgi:hypothetical protein
MDQMSGNAYGILSEGKDLCLNCAEKIYGNSLEMYVSAGEIQILNEQDRPTYASRGLLCDECLNWIFSPDKTEDPWWLEDPKSEERIRLLAPFADFLETLQVDASNLRYVTIS